MTPQFPLPRRAELGLFVIARVLNALALSEGVHIPEQIARFARKVRFSVYIESWNHTAEGHSIDAFDASLRAVYNHVDGTRRVFTLVRTVVGAEREHMLVARDLTDRLKNAVGAVIAPANMTSLTSLTSFDLSKGLLGEVDWHDLRANLADIADDLFLILVDEIEGSYREKDIYLESKEESNWMTPDSGFGLKFVYGVRTPEERLRIHNQEEVMSALGFLERGVLRTLLTPDARRVDHRYQIGNLNEIPFDTFYDERFNPTFPAQMTEMVNNAVVEVHDLWLDRNRAKLVAMREEVSSQLPTGIPWPTRARFPFGYASKGFPHFGELSGKLSGQLPISEAEMLQWSDIVSRTDFASQFPTTKAIIEDLEKPFFSMLALPGTSLDELQVPGAARLLADLINDQVLAMPEGEVRRKLLGQVSMLRSLLATLK